MPTLHLPNTLRIIPQDTAEAMIAVKPSYKILDCTEEINQVHEAENKMSNIYGDFSISDWLNSLNGYEKEKIIVDNPIFFLMEALDSNSIRTGTLLSDKDIKVMRDIDNSAIDLLRDNNLVEEVYPENTELPLTLWDSYQEMDSGPRPAGVSTSGSHLMQRLFHDNFGNGQWESSFNEVVESLSDCNECKIPFINQKETIMNFIKLIHDFDNIFKTINKNQNNG